jgi:hypothetical protein
LRARLRHRYSSLASYHLKHLPLLAIADTRLALCLHLLLCGCYSLCKGTIRSLLILFEGFISILQFFIVVEDVLPPNERRQVVLELIAREWDAESAREFFFKCCP